PARKGYGLVADALEAEVTKAHGDPFLGPPVCRIPGPPDALDEDLLDRREDLVFLRERPVSQHRSVLHRSCSRVRRGRRASGGGRLPRRGPPQDPPTAALWPPAAGDPRRPRRTGRRTWPPRARRIPARRAPGAR